MARSCPQQLTEIIYVVDVSQLSRPRVKKARLRSMAELPVPTGLALNRAVGLQSPELAEYVCELKILGAQFTRSLPRSSLACSLASGSAARWPSPADRPRDPAGGWGGGTPRVQGCLGGGHVPQRGGPGRSARWVAVKKTLASKNPLPVPPYMIRLLGLL